jgi:hypothetical protein
MFNIYLAIFVVIALFVIIGVPYKLKDTHSLTALIFFIGSLIIFIVLGIKWFSQETSIFSKSPVSWPPMTNTCPDYLIYYGRKTSDGIQDTCIDTIGVSKNGALKLFPKGKEPSAGDYYFPLATKSSDPAARNQELCQRAMNCGLTWEGITNGESCISPDGEVTPGSITPPSNCPK